jgi:N utilization substance protein A
MAMSFTELGRMIDILGKERGIKKEIIVSAIEQAFVVAARKKFGLQGEYEAKYNQEDDDIEIYQYKNVVETVKDPVVEISLGDGKKLDPDCEMGDQLGLKIDNPGFTRVDVQTARQIIFQKVRDAEREILYKEFKHRKGEIVTGITRRFERGAVIVDLGKADAVLAKKEMIPGENFKPGDRIQAYLSDVVLTGRGPEIRLSRTAPMFLVKLFEMEVPEIQEGIIEIRSAAREPGHRAKIAVYSREKDIDPVGACVGMKGSRVQNVVNELQGEKIDIVKWSEDTESFVRSSLAPADITNILTGVGGTMDVVLEEDQLSLAIGRWGQNVRLAAMLTGKKINIISKSKLQERIKRSMSNLSQVEGISDAVSQVLTHKGIMSVNDLRTMNPSDLQRLIGVPLETAQKIIQTAEEGVTSGTIKGSLENDEDIITASAVPQTEGYQDKLPQNEHVEETSRFSDAEKRLREELAAFKIK